MTDIKVTKIEFGGTPFRKLRNLSIPIAQRVTLIAGHNGLGKSTLLAFLANNSALVEKSSPKTYLGTKFKANIDEIIHIDYSEVASNDADKKTIGDPRVHYQINNSQLIKRCDISIRQEHQRSRVVPRNEPAKKFTSEGITIGPAQKVPLPTIYLGMKRVLPTGEMNQRRVITKQNKTINKEDQLFISSFAKSVINTETNDEQITTLEIKNTPKYTQHPKYNYHTQSISLGQDSLASIASAFASFQMLKREMGSDYPGGLLLIDEIDVGFHPHAIGKLTNAIKRYAKKFNLQVVATTHSPRMIEAIHPDKNPNASALALDGVVYLHDTVQPQLSDDQSLKAILADMNLEIPEVEKEPVIKIYFEDKEANIWFNKIITPQDLKRIQKNHSVKIEVFDLSLGCNFLQKLPSKEPYFQTVVIALDADSSLPSGRNDWGNFVNLPGGIKNGKGLSPERTLHAFLTEWSKNPADYKIAKQKTGFSGLTSNYIEENLIDTTHNMDDRASAEKWWEQKFDQIKKLKLIEAWASMHQAEVADFLSRLNTAVATVARRIK